MSTTQDDATLLDNTIKKIEWGQIDGDIANQEDLDTVLTEKLDSQVLIDALCQLILDNGGTQAEIDEILNSTN